jgi:Uma2 family endonuclease
MAIRQSLDDSPLSAYHGRRMSEEAYLALPEEKPYLEYVDGVVLQKPAAGADHRRLVQFVCFELGLHIRAVGAGQAGPEQRSHLHANYRLPDVSYWAPGVSDDDDSVPTVAMEVRSPDQSVAELRGKCHAYIASGVREAWLIDPRSQTLEVFDADRNGESLASTELLTSANLPGFELKLADLFAVIRND